jgi:predicted dehydrogenase
VTALRAGIAGCGMIAGGPIRADRPILGNHAQACRDLGLTLAAASDPDDRRRADFARYWELQTVHSDAIEMIRAARLDLLIVATPPETHEAICLAGVAAGVRGILCEKPFTGNAVAAERVRAACAAAGIKLLINFSRRWDESHQALVRELGSGELGEPRVITGVYTGTLRGNGSHLVDTLRMLCPARWTLEWTSELAPGQTDGPVALVLQSDLGARALITPVRDAQYFVFEMDLLATRGRVRLLSNGNDIYFETPIESRDFPGYRYLQRARSLPTQTLPGSFRRALDELRSAVVDQRPVAVDPQEFIGSLALLDLAIARAAGSKEKTS